MDSRELSESLAAEIEHASRPGDPLASVPTARPVPQQEQPDLLGERHQLDLLRWHWKSAYEITLGDDGWHAERRDDGTVLTAETAERLSYLIRADFAARPVPRRSRRE